MKLVVSLFLLGMVLFLPLYILASFLRTVLDGIGGMFGQSLVTEKDAVRPRPGAMRTRNTVAAWLIAIVIFVSLVVGVPQVPDQEQDLTVQLIERMYNTGLSALRIEYADSLLNDLKYDDVLVNTICEGVPPVVYGSHRFYLQCSMLQNAVVGVRVMDKEREVYSDTWVVP